MSTKAKPAALPKNVQLRDQREVYEMFAGDCIRCCCGHMKRHGWVCPHCDDIEGRTWYHRLREAAPEPTPASP